MRNSGCEVPEYMLQMKRPSKRNARKLAKELPKRSRISTEPIPERRKREHREKRIKKLKEAKIKGQALPPPPAKKKKVATTT